MPREDQLEIISPGGQIEFHSLDPQKGITNIGRHPANDIVVESPGVADFHAVLDHQQKPYRIMLLSDAGQVVVSGRQLPPNVFTELKDWDTIELDGYSIVLLEGEAVPSGQPVPAVAARPAAPIPAIVPAPPVVAPAFAVVPTAVPPAQALPLATLALRPPDQPDDVVVAELSANEWTVEVDQTATCQVTIVNGGHLVATFVVRVEGLDESWVTITPPQVNLYEGGRTTVTIAMTPPRLPSSSAGAHHLMVVVSSPNYTGRVSCLGATLHVSPYYEFTVGELAPKQQTVSWRRRSGEVMVPITNKGNSNTLFRLDGDDDERGCRFEFAVPGEQTRLARQAEVHLAADELFQAPVTITPIRRRLFAFRSRQHSFTVTTTMVEGGQLPRSVMGGLKARPLFGPFHVLLVLAGLLALLVFFFQPGPAIALLPDIMTPRHGEDVTFTYDARRFLGLEPTNFLNHINGLTLKLTLERSVSAGLWEEIQADLQPPRGKTTETPSQDGRYRLRAENWLSRIIPRFKRYSREIPIAVTPVRPRIELDARPGSLMQGESVMLYWRADYAETMILEYEGIQETLSGAELIEGHRTFSPMQDTTYTLIASNSSLKGDEETRSRTVVVISPTPTPLPTPAIVRFDVEPLTITAGENVKINWEVEGADTVSISTVGDGLPLKGESNQQPPITTSYLLTALKTGPDGKQAKNTMLKEVQVNPAPTATAVPVAPIVELFEATPKEVIVGKTVKLTWSVIGTTTNIEITAPNFVRAGLASQDTMTVTIEETTLFILTAYNGELRTSSAKEVKALEPTPTPTLTPIPSAVPPTPAPTPTATPYPPPFISLFRAEAAEPLVGGVVFTSSYEGEQGVVYVYEVEVGSRVMLTWKVLMADMVVLEGFGTQDSEGSQTLPDPVVEPATYQLTAMNNKGQNQVSAFVQLGVTSASPPPPPYNVRGTEDAAGPTNTLQWSYREEYYSLIDGYRIYRAQVSAGGDFVPVGFVDNPEVNVWVDQVERTCGKAYYVVAVYTDPVSGDETETEASSSSWYSQPCP